MFAAIAIRVPLAVLPFLPMSQPTRDCLLEVMTPQAIEERAVADFSAAVDRYVKLHRQLARSLPMPPAFDDEDPFQAEELRAAIVAARPYARQGTFFTTGVAAMLRDRIETEVLYHPGAADVILRGGYEPVPGEPGPVVNEPFPPVRAWVRWPPLARALPGLPRELDYALWGRDLVLVDVAANLVLDILPDALPPVARAAETFQ
jgi:hypothetical protein